MPNYVVFPLDFCSDDLARLIIAATRDDVVCPDPSDVDLDVSAVDVAWLVTSDRDDDVFFGDLASFGSCEETVHVDGRVLADDVDSRGSCEVSVDVTDVSCQTT